MTMTELTKEFVKKSTEETKKQLLSAHGVESIEELDEYDKLEIENLLEFTHSTYDYALKLSAMYDKVTKQIEEIHEAVVK